MGANVVYTPDFALTKSTTYNSKPSNSRKFFEKGYSKDGKPHRVQVVLALVQTKQGLPVGYRLFAGHVSEVKTLEPMIEQLRRQYQMQRVVVVADAAMASQENMAMMKARGLDCGSGGAAAKHVAEKSGTNPAFARLA